MTAKRWRLWLVVYNIGPLQIDVSEIVALALLSAFVRNDIIETRQWANDKLHSFLVHRVRVALCYSHAHTQFGHNINITLYVHRSVHHI